MTHTALSTLYPGLACTETGLQLLVLLNSLDQHFLLQAGLENLFAGTVSTEIFLV